MSNAPATGESVLTDAVKAVIGATGEKFEASFAWGIEREGLRIFTQAIMDPDPRYWDDEFAKSTKFGAVITPPIYCTYIGRRARPGSDASSADPERWQ
jgi:acyl dehydratase